MKRYTKENDVVLELFSGSGTTLYECEELNRNYIGFDINNKMNEVVKKNMAETDINYVLNTCDITNTTIFNEKMKKSMSFLNVDGVDFMIAHPPYLDIVKFTDKKEDISNISDVNLFIKKVTTAIKNGYNYLKNDSYLGIVMGDIYRNKEVIPLGFYVLDSLKKNISVKLKGIIVKNIEGNRGKLGAYDIWKYRALKSDYYLFKHEYIFVLKKESLHDKD